ncbi:hypothetical protein HNR23_003487 [Nocardiopsis mwathae]|uniref:Conjugal transfer protein n=1 Tax=Nocardiopsis mwathae TaxID=1472723 RepID=A0A7W9YJP5_9ACTN|nr:conjugal transfer protein [Nocardiopsis mwathae]MBB6173427.1 hypothetical protein [Nocardiopsis mwathae]
MAGRSTARRGGAHDDTAAAGDYDDTDPPVRPSRAPGVASGGRWWVWAGRAVLWAFIIVVIFNGLWTPIRDSIAEPAAEPAVENDEPAFPESAAAAFALRFADTYLNAKKGEGAERAEALAGFVPEGKVSQLNLSGADLTGRDIQVVAVDPQDDNNAVVTLSADVNGDPMRLDVPVYADDDGTSLVVSGRPALLAAPTKAKLPDPTTTENDSAVREELEPRLKRFFEAYAETPEHLPSYLADGAHFSELPEGSLEFAGLEELLVPAKTANGQDDVRQATATVKWRLADGDADNPAELTQSYRLSVVKDGDDWKVLDIQGAPGSFGK